MSVMLLIEHHFEFPSLIGDCTGSSESELTLKALLYVTFSCSFATFPTIRCSGSDVILIVSIPDICVLPYFLYSYENRLTRNTVYCDILSVRSNSGWLPIRCAYFILLHRVNQTASVFNGLKITDHCLAKFDYSCKSWLIIPAVSAIFSAA